jgi:hypothetical protein
LAGKLDSIIVESQKSVLIITDDAASTRELAARIAAELKGHKVCMLSASRFSGVEILPAELYFFGCEAPHPPAFAYLEEVLRHINLAGRSCGVFSPQSGEAISYLSGMVKDSELSLHPQPLFTADLRFISDWVKTLTP